RPLQLGLDTPANLAGRKRRHTVVKVGEFLNVDMRNDVRANSKDLGELDETRPERCDRPSESPRPLAMDIVVEEAGRSHENPAAPVAQECDEEWCEPIPDDKDSEDHGFGSRGGISHGLNGFNGWVLSMTF